MSDHFQDEENDSLFKVISDDALMGICAFDIKTLNCVYANNLARELFELPLGETNLNLAISELFPENVREGGSRPMGDDLLQHEGLYQDIMVRKKNGRAFIANVGVRKLQKDNAKYYLLMFQDVTLQKKLQRDITAKQEEIHNSFQEILTQNKQLKELDLAKDRFLALTTHELRTPLSAMVASAEILKDGMVDTDEERQEFLDMIYEQGQHLSQLINDILDFAKVQAGKMDYFISEQDLFPLIQNELEKLKPMADQDGITFEIVDFGQEANCYFDKVRLSQVINNIASNAIKYNNKKGSVKIWFEDDDENIKVFFKDTGRGIPADVVDKVFDEFETLGKISLHNQGTGLGMPISRRLLEGMGGSILLESELGVGSTFWINVPKTKVLDEGHYRDRPDDLLGDLAA